MTKAEQARIMAWRLRILQHAEGEPRQVARTCRYFGISRTAFYRWKRRFDEIGHWFIDFSTSTFEWTYSDVSESGTYILEGKEVVGHSNGREFPGEYDPDSGILTWERADYRSVEAPQ